MSARTKVFAYKGIVGIVGGDDNINKQPGQLGLVYKLSDVDISPEALEVLKKVKKSGDDIGDIDIFGSSQGPIFGWLGGRTKVIDPSEHEGSSSYDPSLVTVTVPVEPEEGFKQFVEDCKK